MSEACHAHNMLILAALVQPSVLHTMPCLQLFSIAAITIPQQACSKQADGLLTLAHVMCKNTFGSTVLRIENLLPLMF